MTNNCTLLIDGNWLLMNRLFAGKYNFSTALPQEEKEITMRAFHEQLARSVNIALYTFAGIADNVIFVTDGGSWRKKVERPKLMQDETYKGTRERADETDWDFIFAGYREFVAKLSECGMTTSYEWNVEGDDWMWYWTNKLRLEGTSNIIWTSDEDLLQLVAVENGIYTAWYNDKKGLYLHKDCNPESNDLINFFMQSNGNVNQLITLSNIQTTYIDPFDVISKKVLCGDVSDNILSIIRVPSGTKTNKITPKDCAAVMEECHVTDVNELIDNKAEIIGALLRSKRYAQCPNKLEDLYEMFDYNARLVILSNRFIPEDLVMRMSKCEYKQFDVEYAKNNYRVLLGETGDDGEAAGVWEQMEDLPF